MRGRWRQTLTFVQGTVTRPPDDTEQVSTQTEEFSDWRGDVPLAESFFLAERWSERSHWARPARR